MSAPSAADVANILIFVVPGFFARLGYTARFPQRPSEPGHQLIVSIALSVPLVALARELADLVGISTTSTSAAFAIELVVIGLVAGYLAASLRAWKRVRELMRSLGMPFPPEATIYEQTLLQLPEDGQVTITLKGDRVVTGYPAIGPTYEEPGTAREIYLSHRRSLTKEAASGLTLGPAWSWTSPRSRRSRSTAIRSPSPTTPRVLRRARA